MNTKYGLIPQEEESQAKQGLSFCSSSTLAPEWGWKFSWCSKKKGGKNGGFALTERLPAFSSVKSQMWHVKRPSSPPHSISFPRREIELQKHLKPITLFSKHLETNQEAAAEGAVEVLQLSTLCCFSFKCTSFWGDSLGEHLGTSWVSLRISLRLGFGRLLCSGYDDHQRNNCSDPHAPYWGHLIHF